jgi:hypothetical protein
MARLWNDVRPLIFDITRSVKQLGPGHRERLLPHQSFDGKHSGLVAIATEFKHTAYQSEELMATAIARNGYGRLGISAPFTACVERS